MDADRLIVAAATAGAAACIAWLCVGFAVALAGYLPGATGRWATRLSARITAPAIRRAVALALGGAIAGSPLVGPAAGAAAAPLPAPAVPSLDWPLAATSHPAPLPTLDLPTAVRTHGSVATLDWPTSGSTPDWTTVPGLDWTPISTGAGVPARRIGPAHHPAAAPAPVARPRLAPPTSSAPIAGTDDVTVVPGDSLWTIAARALGPRADLAAIAASWPRWYECNRAAIGPDPNLIRPGERLRPPR